MKPFFTQSSFHTDTAAIRNTTETEPSREARSAIVSKFKVPTERQACMWMLTETFKLEKRDG